MKIKTDYSEKTKTTIVLCMAMLLFKFACDAGYWVLLTPDAATYQASFNPVKYAVGLIWCVILFLGIDHNSGKASSFFLYMIVLLQIVPMTTVYSLGNDSSVFYFLTCLSVLMCEILVRRTRLHIIIKKYSSLSLLMMIGFALLAVGTIAVLIMRNGKPSMKALNIYRVYEIRRSGSFQTGGKFLSYVLTWTMVVFLPLGIAKALTGKKYLLAGLFSAVMMLIYLYSGHKSYLFAIPLVVAGTIWAKRTNCYKELFLSLCIGFSLLVLLALCEKDHNGGLFNQMYSLFGRRSMIVSANNKFKYYDYFTNHPKLGIYGIFPRWLVNVKSYYENIPYTFVISDIYYGKPEMNSNTGFLAEGYMRFGYIGIFAEMMIFTLILKQIDKLQARAGYQFAVGAFIYPIFGLADAHLVDSMFFGEWMILLLFILFYKPGLLRMERTHNSNRDAMDLPESVVLGESNKV